MTRSPLRALILAAALGLAGLAVAAPGSAAVVSPGASTSHPFSDPVWYPLRGSATTMGCATSNPGCGSGHPDRAIDFLSHAKLGATYTAQPVYAAGAGIVHIGQNIGNRCTNPSGLGTWIWIDHGGGTVSRYGHLSSIAVKSGQYVTPKTVLGKTGHSGEKTTGDCAKVTNYLNFAIRHGGIHGSTVWVPSLKVCSGTRTVSWPAAVKSTYTSWQRVPNGTPLNNTAGAGNKCVPTSAPATAAAPNSKSLVRAGSGKLKQTWAAPSAGYHVTSTQIELDLYHPSNKTWSPARWHGSAATTKAYTFTGLLHNRTYRAHVSFRNAHGWSKPSIWRSVKTS